MISNLTVTPHTLVNGTFLVDVNFNIVNPEGDIIGIVGNASNYGFFMLDDRPVTLGPLPCDGETEWQFIVYNLAEPNCQSTFTLGTVDCCSISDIVVDQIVCTGTTVYRARVNLSQSNTGNVGFEVYSATGGLLGSFLYANLPVQVTNIPSFSAGMTHLTICDIGNSTCCTVIEYQDPDCNMTDCELTMLNVVTSECVSGDFVVALDFNHNIFAGPNFTVTGNGNNYGTFPYSALPLTLSPLPGDGETIYEFDIQGAGNGPNCDLTAAIGIVDCPPGCGFDDVDIVTLECRGNVAYSLGIDFVPIAPGAAGFSAYAQGKFLGSYSYDDLPVIVDSFPATGDFFDIVTLCDNTDTTCCFEYEFRALRCCCCVINNVTITPSVCDTNNQFYVEIDFYHHMEGDDGFQIAGSGMNFGQFSYDSLPITLGPFNGDSMSYYEFLVFDRDDGFCLDGGELGIVDCDCDFESVAVETFDCTGNGEYSLALNFIPVDVTDVGFDVYAGDEFIGFFLYTSLPVVIPSFPSSGNALDAITICDHDNPTCCVTYEFVGKDCVCEVSAILATTSECDTATNTFDLYLDFQWIGIAEEFIVRLEGDSIATVQGTSLPDTITGLSASIGLLNLSVCGIGHPDCCHSIEFPNPCTGPCSISDFTIGISECDTLTNTFDMLIDFDWIGEVQKFDVYMDGVLLDSLEGVNLPHTIFDLTTPGGTHLISVFARGRIDCFAALEVELDECQSVPCDITELIVEPGQCTGDSTFSLALAFFYQGFKSDFVDLFTGNRYLGQFAADSLPIVIDDFPWNGEEIMSLRVCQRDSAQCCETIEFAAPFCGCEIDAINVNSFCTTDSLTFGIVLDLAWRGDISGFTVHAGPELIAVIDAASLPDTIADFPQFMSDTAEITVCATNNSTCCATTTFLQPVCDTMELCEITIFSIDTFECSGASIFSAWLAYETVGFTGPLQFWANDVFIGEYSQFKPLLVPSIPSSPGPIILRMCNAANPNCCAEIEFQGMDCSIPQCNISGLNADLTSKDSASLMIVTLDFEFENEGIAYTVSGNGNQYGVFTYDNVPLTLEPIACDTTTIWQFVVQDLQNIGCQDTVNVGTVDCDLIQVGVFPDPLPIQQLEIFYSQTGAEFIVPTGATDFSLWTYDGRLVGVNSTLTSGERISVTKYIPVPGLYFVQVRSDERLYVGKVVGF